MFMARPTKELTEQRDEMIKEYRNIFQVLRKCGGGLYVNDLAKIVEVAESTLMYRLKKCVNLELVRIDMIPQGLTRKNIVRLTRVGWIRLNQNRGECGYQENTLDFFFYRAIYNKYFSDRDLKDDFIKEVIDVADSHFNKKTLETLDKDRKVYNQQSIRENLSLLNKTNFFIKDYFLSKNMIRLNIHYINRKIDPKAVAQLMDLIVGTLEMYSFLVDEEYYHTKSNIKIDFEIISESKTNKIELCKYIKKYKRNFYAFTKEKSKKPNMYNSFKYSFKNKIEFHYIDTDKAKAILGY